MLCIDAFPNFIVLLFMCPYEILSTNICQYFPIKFANNICQYFPIKFARYFPLKFSTIICHYFLDIFHYSIFSYYSIYFYIFLLFLYIYLYSEYFFFFILREFSLFYFLREIPLVHKKAATFSAATFCCFIQWLLFHLVLT